MRSMPRSSMTDLPSAICYDQWRLCRKENVTGGWKHWRNMAWHLILTPWSHTSPSRPPNGKLSLSISWGKCWCHTNHVENLSRSLWIGHTQMYHSWDVSAQNKIRWVCVYLRPKEISGKEQSMCGSSRGKRRRTRHSKSNYDHQYKHTWPWRDGSAIGLPCSLNEKWAYYAFTKVIDGQNPGTHTYALSIHHVTIYYFLHRLTTQEVDK